MKLTERRIAELTVPQGKKDALFFDEQQRGLAVRVTAAGSRSYLVQYRLHGQKQRLPIGNVQAIALADARKRALDVLSKAAKDIDPRAEIEEEKRKREELKQQEREARANTLGKLIDKWVAKHLEPNRRPRYAAEAPRALRRAFADDLDQPVAKLTRNRVRAVLDEMPRTMGVRMVTYGRALFSWAIEDEREGIETNPFEMKLPSLPSRDRVLTDDELRRIWHGVEGKGRYQGVVRLLMLTGQRREEVGAMRWSELSADMTTWTIPAERSKNKQAHVVPLSEPAREIIQAQPRFDAFVFGPGRYQGWARRKPDLDLVSGVQGWRLHDLRRTLATGLQRLGVRLEVTEAVLNHTSGSRSGIVAVYQRYAWADEKRQALDAWARHLQTIIEGSETNSNVVPLRKGA